ncbi:MAG: hypothetical protein KBF88_08120 [Polyangiaceae bacterium]|nr:hypothetical protein [Polyangiaceae bacterium]
MRGTPRSKSGNYTHAHCGWRWVNVVLALGALVGTSTGCALIYGLDGYSISSDDAGSPLEGQDSSTDPDADVESDTSSPTEPDSATTYVDAAPPGCVSHAECAALATSAGQDDATICVRATGQCVPLRTEDCPTVFGDYKNENAIVLGALVKSGSNLTFERSVFLAAEEINSAGVPARNAGGSPRPLVIVSCDPGAALMRATRHLAEDLHVPAIVGPLSDGAVIEATQQVTSKSGTLLLSPSAQSSSVTNLSDNDLTWRNVTSDTQRAKLLIDQVNDLETLLRSTRTVTSVKLGVVHQNDARGLSVRDSIGGKLLLNGRFMNDPFNAGFVSIDAYAMPGDAAAKAIVTKYTRTFTPDIVLVTSEDQIHNLIVPLEAALTAARATVKPYYICTDAAKTKTLLDAIAVGGLPADIRRRIRGIGAKPSSASESTLAAFAAAYAAKNGALTDPIASAPAYDATYAIAAAIAATPSTEPSGASVAEGLRRLGVGAPMSVGANLVQGMLTEAARGSISLRGTLSIMRWDSNGDVLDGTLEVWCIGRAVVPTFGSSGRTMEVQSQVVGGGFIQCQ